MVGRYKGIGYVGFDEDTRDGARTEWKTVSIPEVMETGTCALACLYLILARGLNILTKERLA